MGINPYSYGYNGYPLYGNMPQTYMQPTYIQPIYPQQIEQQPQYTQPQPMVQQSVQQPQQPKLETNDSYFVWVQGEAGAKAYPVARGTTLPLFDTEGDFVYFKSVDNNGVPLPLVVKVLSDPESIAQEVKQVEEIPTIPQIDMTQYVTKEKYDELKKNYEDLELRILELETKPTTLTNFTGNTFNNSRKGEEKNANKFTL